MLTIRSSTYDFTPEELREIRQVGAVQHANIVSALNFLRHRGDYRHNTVDEALAELRAESFTPIPSKYLERFSPARTTSTRASPMRGVTSNRPFEEKVAARVVPGTFQVPVNRPLPLSYEAQADLRAVNGERRRNSLRLESGFRSLFTQAANPADAEANHTQLAFLHPPADNPRVQTARRLQEKHAHYRRSDPTARRRYNEPRWLPNLHRKVERDFMPSCVGARTMAAEQLFEGNEERMEIARQNAHACQWRY